MNDGNKPLGSLTRLPAELQQNILMRSVEQHLSGRGQHDFAGLSAAISNLKRLGKGANAMLNDGGHPLGKLQHTLAEARKEAERRLKAAHSILNLPAEPPRDLTKVMLEQAVLVVHDPELADGAVASDKRKVEDLLPYVRFLSKKDQDKVDHIIVNWRDEKDVYDLFRQAVGQPGIDDRLREKLKKKINGRLQNMAQFEPDLVDSYRDLAASLEPGGSRPSDVGSGVEKHREPPGEGEEHSGEKQDAGTRFDRAADLVLKSVGRRPVARDGAVYDDRSRIRPQTPSL